MTNEPGGPGESPGRASRVWFAITLALALIPLVLVGWRLAHKDEWLSAARRMPFVKFDGSVMPADVTGPEGCRSLDIHFKLVIDGSKVWIPCRNEKRESAIGRMDLVAKRVDHRWPFPLWEVSWTEGLLPLPEGRLAIVVRIKGGLGFAVAGPDGWLLRPQELDTREHERVLGMGWNRGKLEVAIGGIDTAREPVWQARIATLDEKGIATRPFTGCGEKCSGILAAYFGGDVRWHVLVNRDHTTALLDATEDGSTRKLNGEVSMLQLDNTAAGVVSLVAPKYSLSPDGKLEPVPGTPPWLRGEELLSYRFMRDGNHLARLGSYEIDGKRVHSDPPGAYSLTFEKSNVKSGTPGTPTWDDQTLGVRTFDVSTFELTQRKPLRHVARIHECSDLGYNGALARVGNELVAFEPSGCYVTLDANLRRTDAWGLWEHLRMRGSMYLGWSERSHAAKLIWVFLAPLVVLGALFVRNRWPRATTALSIVAALAAIWCCVDLWALLR